MASNSTMAASPEAEALGLEDVRLVQREELRPAAVAVHAEQMDVRAAIGLAPAAGDAVAAGEIGQDVDGIAFSSLPLGAQATSPPSSWPMTRG
jgi:hypothetical protein